MADREQIADLYETFEIAGEVLGALLSRRLRGWPEAVAVSETAATDPQVIMREFVANWRQVGGGLTKDFKKSVHELRDIRNRMAHYDLGDHDAGRALDLTRLIAVQARNEKALTRIKAIEDRSVASPSSSVGQSPPASLPPPDHPVRGAPELLAAQQELSGLQAEFQTISSTMSKLESELSASEQARDTAESKLQSIKSRLEAQDEAEATRAQLERERLDAMGRDQLAAQQVEELRARVEAESNRHEKLSQQLSASVLRLEDLIRQSAPEQPKARTPGWLPPPPPTAPTTTDHNETVPLGSQKSRRPVWAALTALGLAAALFAGILLANRPDGGARDPLHRATDDVAQIDGSSGQVRVVSPESTAPIDLPTTTSSIEANGNAREDPSPDDTLEDAITSTTAATTSAPATTLRAATPIPTSPPAITSAPTTMPPPTTVPPPTTLPTTTTVPPPVALTARELEQRMPTASEVDDLDLAALGTTGDRIVTTMGGKIDPDLCSLWPASMPSARASLFSGKPGFGLPSLNWIAVGFETEQEAENWVRARTDVMSSCTRWSANGTYERLLFDAGGSVVSMTWAVVGGGVGQTLVIGHDGRYAVYAIADDVNSSAPASYHSPLTNSVRTVLSRMP